MSVRETAHNTCMNIYKSEAKVHDFNIFYIYHIYIYICIFVWSMRTVKSEEEQVGKDEDDNDDDDDDDDDALGGVMYWSKYSPIQKLISVHQK